MRSTLARLELPSSLDVVAYGVPLCVRTTSTRVLAKIVERLPPGHRSAPPSITSQTFTLARVDEVWRVYEGRALVARVAMLGEALDRLESRMHAHVARHAPERVFVHAGAVGWRGKAILLPGPSYAGKSTLVAALVRAGATFYSDEFAVLDGAGRVHPYPRRMSLRRAAQQPSRRSAEQLGGRTADTPSAVGWVIFCHYRSGARFVPESLSPGRATVMLFKNAIGARTLTIEQLRFLDRAAIGARSVRGVRGEAKDVVKWLARAGE